MSAPGRLLIASFTAAALEDLWQRRRRPMSGTMRSRSSDRWPVLRRSAGLLTIAVQYPYVISDSVLSDVKQLVSLPPDVGAQASAQSRSQITLSTTATY